MSDTDIVTPDETPTPTEAIPPVAEPAPTGDTLVPGAEDTFDHQPQPIDPGVSTVAYCAACGVLVVQGLGGWQHAPETTA